MTEHLDNEISGTAHSAILLTGAAGYLGSYVLRALRRLTGLTIYACVHKTRPVEPLPQNVQIINLDLASNSSEFKSALSPLQKVSDLRVIHLASLVPPGACESNPPAGENLNVGALQRLYDVLPGITRLLAASSEYVYGESLSQRGFTEVEPLHPFNVYAHQKATAERIANEHGHTALRYPSLFGPSLNTERPNFYDHIVADLLSGRSVDLFSDSQRNFLDFFQAADFTARLLLHWGSLPPAVNICADVAQSRFDLVQKLCRTLKVPESLARPIFCSSHPVGADPIRIRNVFLDNSLLKNLLGIKEVIYKFSGSGETYHVC